MIQRHKVICIVIFVALFCSSLCQASRISWSLHQTTEKNTTVQQDNASKSKFGQAMFQGLAMILVSEIGDETFIIAAILAMKHPRTVIFIGAFSALAIMTVISAALGVVVPALISPELTHHAATLLYTIFGARLLYIATQSSTGETEEEIKEVEEKVADSHRSRSQLRRFMNKLCIPVLLEACILTFVAEWGDRSQIATITLSSHLDPIGVTIGAIVGHALCTGLAVIGGQLIAMRISQRTAAIAGSCLFFAFALHNALWG